MKLVLFVSFLILLFLPPPAEGEGIEGVKIAEIQNELEVEDIFDGEQFRDPFSDYREFVDMEEIEDQDEVEDANGNSEKPGEPGKRPPPPGFILRGLVRRGTRNLVLIEDNGESILIEQGERYGDYRFVTIVNRTAVFERGGHEYGLEPGGVDAVEF